MISISNLINIIATEAADTAEQLWKDPDWSCPKCSYTNLAVRQKCRNCGYDSNCGEFPWYNPMPPYDGLPKADKTD